MDFELWMAPAVAVFILAVIFLLDLRGSFDRGRMIVVYILTIIFTALTVHIK